jgi:hypothetical protein
LDRTAIFETLALISVQFIKNPSAIKSDVLLLATKGIFACRAISLLKLELFSKIYLKQTVSRKNLLDFSFWDKASKPNKMN